MPTEGPVSFADDVQPILAGSCALSGCHGANANPAEKPMVLSVGQAYDNIVGVASAELPAMPRVSPSQPDNSYLIHKIQGMQLSVGGSGDRMPLGQPALSQPTIDLIRRWDHGRCATKLSARGEHGLEVHRGPGARYTLVSGAGSSGEVSKLRPKNWNGVCGVCRRLHAPRCVS